MIARVRLIALSCLPVLLLAALGWYCLERGNVAAGCTAFLWAACAIALVVMALRAPELPWHK